MSVSKRLFRYAMKYKKMFIIALLMLGISVAAELTGPFIAKKMIDTNILGIEKVWYETGAGENAVSYQGKHYTRSDRMAEAPDPARQARVLQVGRQFVFTAETIVQDGERKWEEGKLAVTAKDGSVSVYQANLLTTGELFSFYKPELPYILLLVGFYMVLLVISALFQYGERYILQISANRVIQTLRLDVYAHIQRLPVQYFDNLPAGKVVSRVTNDTEAVRDLFVSVLANFFSGFVYITGIYVALFLLNPGLAGISLLLLPLLALWFVVYRKFANKYNKIIRSRLSDINAMINESIQGMPIIRIFRRQKETNREFEELNQEYFKYQNKMLSLNALTGHNLTNVLRNLSLVVALWYFGGASLTAGTAISLGVLYAYVDYLGRLFQPVTGMANQLANLEQSLVSAERVFKLMDEPGEPVSHESMPRYRGDVVFDKVSFAYKEEEYVLKRVSFEAKQGETVALVGHTGSGKSSIMNLLFRFYDPQKGEILIDGMRIRDIPKQMLRQHMGIVLQDPFLFTGTVASNVSLNDPSISRERVEKALRDVGSERVLAHLPKGYDETVLEKGSTLSAGQRQIISFARALAFDPAILILDEATASIDTETEAVIQEALEVLKQGRTTFIIAHRLSTIRNADQILVLHRGEIAERGPHDTLMQLKGRYYRMYELQQGKKAAEQEIQRQTDPVPGEGLPAT
ncbi:ABC transporter ATP-binding protein [Paenibacillus larvae]|uniref:Putative multidrug resistance ABC transporter ATP-binding/permease protein YheH n=2 Tax=Paenibacillus larvae subsp. larvae TaxID=147375 RepID=V9WEY7_9BACL|nr:ABC transporter ATP-binding protein [Paenibacillus larvae]AHD07687.1 putative multidrug resistance ABC transporter ATP-binding/permease protein YheH [Paenibacillus larvae subsp. larvae DSM 25430]AVG14246.1 putative multidrug resistance ABC transporter ATP-binding/permease protein YheH [Paenibacillus larvae subsp. larvae DSM 25430]MCY9508688.1 ABC transporter ATP-binding protein/permease [Paenibacillus larvae]MCY9525264.1 ABC transporter ATP-binding protein/permease [Paenibacillus larvae]MDR